MFGDDIDTYDLLRAVEDGATVPVAFEPRLIKLERAEGVRMQTSTTPLKRLLSLWMRPIGTA